MKTAKDLNWLSAPAFFLIIGMLIINTKKTNVHVRQTEKVKTAVASIQKPS